MTHPLIEQLDRIDSLVNDRAWDRALSELVAFDSRVRNDPATRHIRVELVERHRALALKLASIRAETAVRLQQLGRGHSAAKRYLTASAV